MVRLPSRPRRSATPGKNAVVAILVTTLVVAPVSAAANGLTLRDAGLVAAVTVVIGVGATFYGARRLRFVEREEQEATVRKDAASAVYITILFVLRSLLLWLVLPLAFFCWCAVAVFRVVTLHRPPSTRRAFSFADELLVALLDRSLLRPFRVGRQWPRWQDPPKWQLSFWDLA